MKSSILLALALPLLGGAAPSRYTPARTGLQVVDGPATLNAALTYPCEEDSTKKCTGISHSEALFGVPKYGSSIQAYLYEAPAPSTDPAESACGTTKIVPDPSWASPFILIVNRGECHFTEKVRNAAKAGAVGVIVADNIALANEPLAYCPDYTPPQYYDGNSWVPCTTAAHGLNCKCGDDHSVAATLLTSAPTCSGNTSPEYQPVCTDTKVVKDGPCWYCPPGAKGGSAQSFPSSCFHGKETTNCQRDTLLPYMADDGDGGDITIPSFIISDYNGALLKQAVRTQAAAAKTDPTVKRVQVRMAWDLKVQDRVDYELWTSCEDSNGAEFKRDFMETALKLINAADFTPKYYIYDGHALQCDGTYNCGTQCISGGLYCGPDPDNDLANGVNGADVVKENLRQICIWNVLSKSVDGGADRKELMKWWCYVNDFGNQCFNEKSAMVSGETFKKCADDIMAAHQLDVKAIEACVDGSFVEPNGPNSLLKQEILDAKDYGVLKLPEAVVNGVVLRGQTGYGASLELNVATAICNGFTPGSRPKECDDIITPEGTLGQSGNAKVKFIASLGYVDMLAGGPLTSSSLSTTMVERFRSTLSMKLGVDPQVIQISKPDLVKSGSNSVTVNVQVSNLKCSDDGSSKSSKVVESLKGIATCEAEASSDAQVEAETKVGEKFYFHTAAAHGSTNRQVVSTITEMEADESQCVVTKGDGGGVGIGWVIFIAIFCSGLVFGGAFFIWRRKAKEQMRNEVKAILADYMQLDEISSGDMEMPDTRMLEGGGSSSTSVAGRI